MVLTKELAAKGSAILGSAGAGGTGLYYGGGYLFGEFAQQGTSMTNYLDGVDTNILFDVKVVGDNNTEQDLNSNPFPSPSQNFPITVKVKPSQLSTTNLHTATTNTEDVSATMQKWTCSFRFEVEGDVNNIKTISQNH